MLDSDFMKLPVLRYLDVMHYIHVYGVSVPSLYL